MHAPTMVCSSVSDAVGHTTKWLRAKELVTSAARDRLRIVVAQPPGQFRCRRPHDAPGVAKIGSAEVAARYLRDCLTRNPPIPSSSTHPATVNIREDNLKKLVDAELIKLSHLRIVTEPCGH